MMKTYMHNIYSVASRFLHFMTAVTKSRGHTGRISDRYEYFFFISKKKIYKFINEVGHLFKPLFNNTV